MFDLGILKEFLTPINYSWFSYVVAVLHLLIGVVCVTFTATLRQSEGGKFQCDFPPDTTYNNDYLKAKCYQKYDERYNSPLPLYGTLFLSFASVVVVCFIYSCSMQSKIRSRVAPTQNAKNEDLVSYTRNTRSRRVFGLYLIHLVARLGLMILFTALYFNPSGFPHEFDCASPDFNVTNTLNCHSSVARDKTFVSRFVWILNIVFLFLVFGEIVYLVLRALRKSDFTIDRKFCAEYFANRRLGFRERLKRTTLRETEKLERLTACEGERFMDDTFVHLELQFRRGMSEKITLNGYEKLYLPNENTGNGAKVLIIGPPGTGKSLLCKKLLRDWSKKSYSRFDFAFLFKFGCYNSEATEGISLRQLLNLAPQSESELDKVIQQLLNNPEKILLLFDGLDEFRDYERCRRNGYCLFENKSEEKMPVSALYVKLLQGKLLPGATVLTTSRPDVISRIDVSLFDKILDIKEFTEEKVHEYVGSYCKQDQDQDPAVAGRIKEHINNNSHLLSLCSIPLYCHIVCYLLMKELKEESNPESAASLPTRPNTAFYKKILAIAISRHHPEYRDGSFEEGAERFSDSVEKNSENLKNLEELGMLARRGIREERTAFSPEEVRNVTRNFGLLKEISDGNGNPCFCFIRPVFQHFLAARAIVGSAKLEKNIEEVIGGLKNGNTKWSFVIQFVAGFLDHRHKEVVKCFINCLHESLLSSPNNGEMALLMMKCLHEYNDNNLLNRAMSEPQANSK